MLTKAETLLELSFSVAWKCSVEKGVLKAIAKFIGRHLLTSLFFNKVACCTLFEKFPYTECFLVRISRIFGHFSRSGR